MSRATTSFLWQDPRAHPAVPFQIRSRRLKILAMYPIPLRPLRHHHLGCSSIMCRTYQRLRRWLINLSFPPSLNPQQALPLVNCTTIHNQLDPTMKVHSLLPPSLTNNVPDIPPSTPFSLPHSSLPPSPINNVPDIPPSTPLSLPLPETDI